MKKKWYYGLATLIIAGAFATMPDNVRAESEIAINTQNQLKSRRTWPFLLYGFDPNIIRIVTDQTTILQTEEETNTDNTKNEYMDEWVNGVYYNSKGNSGNSTGGLWRKSKSGWWYQYYNKARAKDTYIKDSWAKIDGVWYFFNKNGYMASNEYYDGYWFNKDGSWTYEYQASWKKNKKGWWYGDASGWYARNSWLKIDGKWYHFDKSGYIQTGWQKISGKWYYFDGSGVMVTGTKTIGGKSYTFGSDGVMKEESSSGLKVGDIITFGHYEQDNNISNGKEAIEWRVLDIKGDKLLVISSYVLENKPFHSTLDRDVTWDRCSLREWLNGIFYNEAFSANEKSKILTTNVKAESSINELSLANGRSGTGSPVGSDTKDKIFLLSIKEARKYFVGEIISKAGWANYVPQTYCLDRACQPTKYAVNQGAEIGFTSYYKRNAHGGRDDYLGYTKIDSYYVRNEETNNELTNSSCWWLLRERGWDDNEVAAVSIYGNVYPGHYPDIDKGVGVRPVMWIQQ